MKAELREYMLGAFEHILSQVEEMARVPTIARSCREQARLEALLVGCFTLSHYLAKRQVFLPDAVRARYERLRDVEQVFGSVAGPPAGIA